jgi:hypothetical protein
MRWPYFDLGRAGGDSFFAVHHWLIFVSVFVGVQCRARLQADLAVRIAKTFKAIPL